MKIEDLHFEGVLGSGAMATVHAVGMATVYAVWPAPGRHPSPAALMPQLDTLVECLSVTG